MIEATLEGEVMNKDQKQGWIREITGKLRTGLGKTIGTGRSRGRGAWNSGLYPATTTAGVAVV